MQPISSYDTSNRFLRLLLQGPPKAGKSVLACQFPKPYIIDLDVNLGGPLRWIKEQNAKGNKLALPVGYDVVDHDEKGILVELKQRFLRLDKLLKEAQVNPEIETIILDSGTQLVDILINEVLRQQQKTAMSKQEWGFFFTMSKNFFGTLAQMRKHIIVPVHEKINKDPTGAVVLPYEVAWPGQFGSIIGAFMTDVWRCECQEVTGLVPTYKYMVKTMPNYQFKLGNSLGLPPSFEFKWEVIEAKLKGN